MRDLAAMSWQILTAGIKKAAPIKEADKRNILNPILAQNGVKKQ